MPSRVAGNSISDEGAAALSAGLAENGTLVILFLADNAISATQHATVKSAWGSRGTLSL